MCRKSARLGDDARNAPLRSLEEIQMILADRGIRLTRQGVQFVLKRAEAKIAKALSRLSS